MRWFALLLGLACSAGSATASEKGLCPPLPRLLPQDSGRLSWAPGSEAPQPNAVSTGPGRLEAVVSNKGFVCSAAVMASTPAVDQAAEAAAKAEVEKWQMTPAKKDGHAVPVVVLI